MGDYPPVDWIRPTRSVGLSLNRRGYTGMLHVFPNAAGVPHRLGAHNGTKSGMK